MDNNNNFENGFYGSAPQKPFTDKSCDVPVNPQAFSGEGESVNQPEQTAFDDQNVQNTNTAPEQMQNVIFHLLRSWEHKRTSRQRPQREDELER